MRLGGTYASVALVRAANAVFMVTLSYAMDLPPELHGAVLAAYALSEALSGIFMGVLVERIGARLSIALASFLLIFAYTGMELTRSFSVALPLNAMAGVAAAIVLVSSLSEVAESTKGRERMRIYGSGGFEAANLGGYAIGFALALALEYLQLSQGFYVSALLAALALSASIFVSSERKAARLEISARSLWLVPLWLGLAIMIGVAFMGPKIVREAGISIGGIAPEGKASPVMIVGLMAASVALLGASYVVARIGKRSAVIFGSLAAPPAMLSFGALYDRIFENLALLPILALLALPIMLLPPSLLALLADETDAIRYRGSGMGLYVTVLGIGVAIGEYLVGGAIFQRYGIEGMMGALALLFAALSAPTILALVKNPPAKGGEKRK